MMDCCGRCAHIHERPRTSPPKWLSAVSCAGYLLCFGLSLVCIVLEIATDQKDSEIPFIVWLSIVGVTQYVSECALAYAGIVMLWSWKPYHLLQHHLTAVALFLSLNMQLVADPDLWLETMRVSLPLRVIFISCAFTGINEAMWAVSNFAADPKATRLAWLRVSCGMFVLIQNIVICVVCLLLYSVNTLWPLFTDGGSAVALVQIVVNGIVQTTGFHLGLQGMFLRLQLRLMRRLYRGESSRKPEEDRTAASAIGKPQEGEQPPPQLEPQQACGEESKVAPFSPGP